MNYRHQPMMFAAACLFGAAITLPTGAIVADEGLYIEGRAGISLPTDSDLDTATTSQEVDLDNGYVGNIAVGHGYKNGIRTELELGLRKNDVESISGGGGANGDVQSWSLMGNVLYDFNVSGSFTPYIGAGLGIAKLDVDGASPSTGVTINDDDTAFAWQGMAGVAYHVNDRIRLTLGYRYFSVPDADFNSSAGTRFESDYSSHDVLFGFRYKFGGPEKKMVKEVPAQPQVYTEMPAPPPPPAPVVARNFLVFFDFNQSSLTLTAEAIIDSAADAAKHFATEKLRLTGHADRAGSTRYNQRLSLSRGNAVRAALTRLGVSAKHIAVVAKGESEPLVATRDGVREPQNRRVQIILE